MTDPLRVGVDLSSRQSQLYVAYGDDMDAALIAARCGRAAELAATASLADYALAFHGRDERWDGGEETIARQRDAMVWGVVWRLAAPAFDRLDAWRGVRLDGSGTYFHTPVDVVGIDGATWSAVTYRKSSLGEAVPPSVPHLATIVAAARGAGLPEAYARTLEARPTVAPSGPVPRASRLDRYLAAARLGGACAC